MTTHSNTLFVNLMNLLYSLSFYSPIIVCVSILVFSMFATCVEKTLIYFMWIFVITFLRIIVFKGLSSPQTLSPPILPPICLTGVSEMFIPKDVLYSLYVLSFTMMYFITPMILVSAQTNTNMVNYGVVGFFAAYIVLDIFVKQSVACIANIVSKTVFVNLTSGLFFGALIGGLVMYGTPMRSYLFINEINANKEVCSRPSKQQFKCRVYKNGTLVGTSN